MDDRNTAHRRPLRVFMSHSTRDREIAEELKDLFGEVFDGQLMVEFSSDQEAGGGIPPGEQWLPWITKRIKRADVVLILLTPGSVDKPWILWESGAAAGVALARDRTTKVVPVVFGLAETSIPGPLRHQQYVLGDGDGPNGMERLLRSVNDQLEQPLTDGVLRTFLGHRLPGFRAQIARVLAASAPSEELLATVPPGFSVEVLEGHWITCYRFRSAQGGEPRCHADLARVEAISDRRLRARNFPPEPRTEGHARAFRNEIDAVLAGRHLVGNWRNLSDRSYFGAVHLTVLAGETILEGHYTAVTSAGMVASGGWRWVRVDPDSVSQTDLSAATLSDPRTISELVDAHTKYAAPLPLSTVLEGPHAGAD